MESVTVVHLLIEIGLLDVFGYLNNTDEILFTININNEFENYLNIKN